jgi:hypothetical protein
MQLRLNAAAVREMQRRAADIRYSVERQVEDGYTKPALEARFVAFIEDSIALLNPGLAVLAQEVSEEGTAAMATLEAARSILSFSDAADEEPEVAGKKGGKKGKKGVEEVDTPKPTSETMEKFGHLFDTTVGLNTQDAKLREWLRLVLPQNSRRGIGQAGVTAGGV